MTEHRTHLAAPSYDKDFTSLTEPRTQAFLPWNEHTWNTPDVAHDNPREHRLPGSVILGFADDVASTLTFVEGGEVLPEPHA
jgi:hypothetical protein